MALNEAINDHATGSYTIKREKGESWVNSKRVPGSITSIAGVTMSVQPANGEELTDLPEGQTLDDVRVIYSATALYARKPAAIAPDMGMDYAPDIVVIDGEDYRVWKSEKWDHWGETHWRAYAAKLRP